MNTTTADLQNFTGTDRQASFIGRLLEDRQATEAHLGFWAGVQDGTYACDKAMASRLIGDLLKRPRKARPAPATVEEGYYLLEGAYYAVVPNRQNTARYAKVWNGDTNRWDYAPSGYRALAAAKAEPMTLEQAASFGHAHGHCIRCGRLLTNPESVEAGIGPICAGYWQ